MIVIAGGSFLLLVFGNFVFQVVHAGLLVCWFIVWWCLGVLLFALWQLLSLVRFCLREVVVATWSRFGVAIVLFGCQCAFV